MGLKKVREVELVIIDGGRELSDALLWAAGWLTEQAVNVVCETVSFFVFLRRTDVFLGRYLFGF
ncbi:hypothetical protein HQ35_09965 [Porphyromonas cangingivalis]|uniref:Uncharacterized protein n=1 Tax=Porphyromonas cangingivalis TaxID=36874 RepID=A0A0A2EQ89_PORCN|nr:hypothetical protein HQ35_09965 [Porphyromonas cangingivalis]